MCRVFLLGLSSAFAGSGLLLSPAPDDVFCVSCKVGSFPVEIGVLATWSYSSFPGSFRSVAMLRTAIQTHTGLCNV